jgi:hypothetical protein
MRLIASNQGLDAIDRYRKGEVGAYIGLRSRLRGHQCHLAFFRIPADPGTCRTGNVFGPTLTGNFAGKSGASIANFERDESTVFLGVTELVKGPEGIIPSFVWAERQKQRCDFRRTILGDLPAVSVVIEAGRVVSERKVSSFGGDLFAGDGTSVANLVENVYRTRFFGHKFELSGLLHAGVLPSEPRLARAA